MDTRTGSPAVSTRQRRKRLDRTGYSRATVEVPVLRRRRRGRKPGGSSLRGQHNGRPHRRAPDC